MTQGAPADGQKHYKVVHGAGVQVLEHPDSKSLKLCSLGHGQVVDTFEWDWSQSWRKVRAQNDLGQPVEGWVQVQSEAQGALLEPADAPPPAKQPEMDMDVAKMLEMQRQIAEKLAALGVQQAAAPAPQPATVEEKMEAEAEERARAAREAAARAGGFASFAQDCGLVLNRSVDELEEAEEPPPRSSVGQLYQVIHKPKVAIRQSPSLKAPCIRSVFHGMSVELFEWDRTRQWRRIPVDRAIDPTEVIMEGDEVKEGTVRADGWILIEHPTLGPLMEAVCQGLINEESLFPRDDAPLELLAPEAGSPPPGADEEQPQQGGPVHSGEASPRTPKIGSPRIGSPKVQREGWFQEPPAAETEWSQEVEPPRPRTMEERISLWHEHWEPTPFTPGPVKNRPDRELKDQLENLRVVIEQEDEVLDTVEERPGLNEPRLMRAVRAGNYEIVRQMLQRCVNLNETDSMGETALFEAASSARIDLVGLLLVCKAEPTKRSKEGISAMQLASDKPTRTLLSEPVLPRRKQLERLPAERQPLVQAILLAPEQDRGRLAEHFGLAETDLVITEDKPPEKPTEKPMERLMDDAITAAPVVDSAATAAPAAPPGAEAPAAAAPPAPSAEAAAPEPVELEAPERTEEGKWFQVVYKMVAVRRSPDTKAESIRGLKKGTKILMFETDKTRQWRRVRVEAPRGDEAGDDASMEEVDGWMLLRSEKVGLLLQEIEEEEDDDDEEAG